MKYTVHRALSLIKSTKSRIEKEFSEDAPAWIRVARGQEDSIRGVSVEEIRREIQSHYDRVTALIENYIALKSAVVQSNAGVLPGTEPVEVPALVEVPAVEKIQPSESKPPSVQPVTQEFPTKQPTKPEESFAAEEIFIPPAEPIHYAEPAPQPTQPATNPAPTKEIAKKNPAPELDYSAADSSEITGSFMPREVFASGENWSEEETDKKYEEYVKRVEVGRRVEAFIESLPDDLSEEERNAAVTEFHHRANDALGLKWLP